MKIEKIYSRELPSDYLIFLYENPKGKGALIKEGGEEHYWTIWGESDLLESWEMVDVGTAMNFECLKLYVKCEKDFGKANWTESNNGKISLDRVESGFVIGSEYGDYLYIDPFDDFSVWIYYHEGMGVFKIAESFNELKLV